MPLDINQIFSERKDGSDECQSLTNTASPGESEKAFTHTQTQLQETPKNTETHETPKVPQQKLTTSLKSIF